MDADKPFADSAVLIIDVINDFAFPGSDQLLQQMPSVVRAIDALRRRADAFSAPSFTSTTLGRWRSKPIVIVFTSSLPRPCSCSFARSRLISVSQVGAA